MSQREFDARVKQLLDGEITLADLPPELRVEGEEALALLAAVDRGAVELPRLTQRVMGAIKPRGGEHRLRFRPWLIGPVLAAAAALVVWLVRPTSPAAGDPSVVTVRFVLTAPEARHVSIAGTFNQWDADATPLIRTSDGVWTATLTLPAGQHQYAFVVDGARWVPDPGAPAVDDGFGRRNSILAL